MTKTKKVGRPIKPEKEKKVQIISYIPKMNASKFKTAIEPFIAKYGTI